MVSKGPFPATASEVVAVFDREDEVRFAIGQFRRSGFDRAVLTILSHTILPHMELVEKLRELRRDCRDHENRAREILARYPARDVHLHGAQPCAATGR